MNNYTPLDCKHCVNHYINNRKERPIGQEWCLSENWLKVNDYNDDTYYDKLEDDYTIIIRED